MIYLVPAVPLVGTAVLLLMHRLEDHLVPATTALETVTRSGSLEA